MKTNLSELRKRAGIRQYQFANILEISKSHMCQLESGKRLPTLNLAFIIAGRLKTTVDQIWSL